MRLTRILAAIALAALPALGQQGAIEDAFRQRFGGNVRLKGASAGQVAGWDGTAWVPTTASGALDTELQRIVDNLAVDATGNITGPSGSAWTLAAGTGRDLVMSSANAQLILRDGGVIDFEADGDSGQFDGPNTRLEFPTTWGICIGTTSNDVRWEKGATKTWSARVGDDSAQASIDALALVAYSGASSFDNSTRGNTLGSNTALLLVDPDSGSNIRSYAFGSSASDGPTYVTSRGHGTHSSPTAVASGDYLAGWIANGYWGTGVADEGAFAAIQMFVDGTPGAGDAPGRIGFYTVPDGSGTLAERLRITNAGILDMGANSLQGGSAVGTRDVRLRRSTTKTYELDDGAAGAASLSIVGNIAQTTSASTTGAGTVVMEGFKRRVYTYTGGAGNATVLTESQSGAVILNTGATAETYQTLPTLTAASQLGVVYTLVIDDSDGARFTAGSGDTITLSSVVGASAGNVRSTTVGSSITLVAVSTSQWLGIAATGVWQVN